MAFDLEPAATLPWLVRLRWSFLIGQLVVLAIVRLLWAPPLLLPAIAVEIAVMGATNVALTALRARRRWSRSQVIGAVMMLDTGLITLLLAGSGGAMNPFTVLYLVHITLSAIVLAAWWTVAVTALSLACFALLFVVTPGTAHLHESMMFGHHLQAMWAAFAFAAILVAFFVGRVTRAITAQREQIAQLREATERSERLASVTRLAAGAAHELGSPLGTIAVAAHEAKRHVLASALQATIITDLDLIVLEVERCQDVLGRLAARGPAETDERATLAELAATIRDQLGETVAARVELAIDGPEHIVTTSLEQLVQSVVALAKNALDATRERVVVRLAVLQAGGVEIAVEDRGDGIPAEVLARIGTPFFTTKETGRGLGLGVFLARSFCESRSGTLTITSERGRGTRAVIWIPGDGSGGAHAA